MKIAVDYSFGHAVSGMAREGIFKYNMFLLEGLFHIAPTTKIEFWCIDTNVDEFKDLHKNVVEKYKKQISFITGKDLTELYHNVQKSKADVTFVDVVSFFSAHYSDTPKVFTLHDLFTVPLRDLFFEVFPNIDEMNKNAADNLSMYAKNGANFIVFSKYNRETQLLKCVENLSLKKINIVRNPPMLRTFETDNILSKEDFKAKFNISGAYIPYPSQNRPNKNVIVLLRALKRLRDDGIKIQLVTTGRMDTLPHTTQYVEENNLQDIIIETGGLSESDLYALYKYADLAVIPTIIEGPGMPQQTLESLILGLPIIQSKAWGIEESLDFVGLSMETAPLNWFDVDDDETLAKKIVEVLQNPQPHIEKQKHIIDAYTKRTWEDTARDYLKVFEKAIKENKKHPCKALELKEVQNECPLWTIKPSKRFFGFYSLKYKNGERIKRYGWGLYKKVKSPKRMKHYLGGIRIYSKKKK